MKTNALIARGILSSLLGFTLFVFSACEKSDWEKREEKAESAVSQSLKQTTKSLTDIDTTLNASADDFVYFETYGNERNCGCVPPIKVEIVTGVPVFTFPLGGSYECKSFTLKYTINGATYSTSVSGTGVHVSDVRIGYGEGCEGRVTLTCTSSSSKCKPLGPYSGSEYCSRTVHFSLKEGSGGTVNPNSCGRNYGEVVVEVTKDGKLSVIVSLPSIVDNEMAPTRLDVRYGDRIVRSSDLEIGENTVDYNTGIYGYQIRMYNPDLCTGSGPTYHYLECDLLGGPGLKQVREINNNH